MATGGSQSAASVGPTIQKAAESAKTKLIQLAVRDKKSPFSGMKDVSYDDGQLVGGGKRADFGTVLNATENLPIGRPVWSTYASKKRPNDLCSFSLGNLEHDRRDPLYT